MFYPGVLNAILVAALSVEFVFSVVLAAVSPEESKLIFYYGPNFDDSVSYNLSDANMVLDHPNFNMKETHLYIHGYKENQSSRSIHLIVSAYTKRKTINLLTIDWAKAAGVDYFTAALVNIKLLGPALADMILKWYNAGLERESLTVVGHSLGAQLSGITGREVIRKSNKTRNIYRMAILDPAFPLFNRLRGSVNAKDAEFLQTIHTDIGTYGHPEVLGHVDFWPNGGLQGQPGCPNGFLLPFSKEDLCSHHRSWEFWAESVSNMDGPEFFAFPARSYKHFLKEGITNLRDKAIEMGINCPMDARGNYYLKTNDRSPFALGFDGYNKIVTNKFV